ncbi:ABC transporter permease [Tunturiibacter gelidoferens]|uniref:Putative permease n=1 Tax=Tunturiibacter lichenicola TaxID=2051959 RepID=A0A7Y9NQ40_9BACT|nr:ABC transporter permease [Edaphobacter lichenicola]NYF53491.1 putative permease [Edaphobacter lichenicola]
MGWLQTLWSRCVAFFGESKLDEELDEELLTHLDLAVEENLHRGMSPQDARRAALLKFGGVAQTRESYRRQRGLPFVDALIQDVRFGTRQIRHSPGFALIAILTLSLGIGANTAVFTLTHALLLKTLPVRDPGELVRLTISMSAERNGSNAPLNLPIIEFIESHSRSFHGIFAWCVYDFPFRDGAVNSGIHGAILSGNAFQSLGVNPSLGRLLTPADDQPGGGPDGLAAVISHRIWIERYQASPSVLGRHITVTDHSATIVGVAPAGFEGVIVAEHPDIYLPLEFQAILYGQDTKRDGGRLWLDTFARLNPGVTRAQAEAEISALFPAILDATLPPALRHMPQIERARLEVRPASTGWSRLRSQYTEPLLLLQLMVAAVLLICCANLSGLFLARASARRQEFAIRGALGASRLRIMRQLFVECLMLALPGALLGIWLATLSGPWILHMLGNAEAEQAISMRPNLTVLSVTIACAVFCAFLFGMAPAWTAGRTSVDADLRSSHPRMHLGAAGLGSFFVPFQLALSLTLVVIAALFGTTITHLLTEDSGYRTDNVLIVLTDFLRIPEKGDALVALYRRMAARMEELPGIEQASVAAISPLMGDRWMDEFVAADKSGQAQPTEVMGNVIAAHYFSAVGIPILAGRDLENKDSDRNSCVISHAAARLYFPNTSALGKTLRNIVRYQKNANYPFHDFQIVGIVQDTKYDTLRESTPPIVYLPITTGNAGMTNAGANLFFVIHARNDAAARSAYLTALHEMAPSSPEIAPFEFKQTFLDSVSRERLLSAMSGFFAFLGLLLSGIGVYGLVAWNVTRRTTEIGLRMALGATRMEVFHLVMRQVMRLLAIGLFAGGLGAFFAARMVRDFLFEIQPGNPAIFLSSAMLLVSIAVLAALLPARRAVSIDPMQALKTE